MNLLRLLVAQRVAAGALRVCADPNILPFSNAKEQGFENRIARSVAADLGTELRYVWWRQRRGNVRSTLNAGLCDLIPGVGSRLEIPATTRPYYRSTYGAVTRPGALSDLASFDPRLRWHVASSFACSEITHSGPKKSGRLERRRNWLVSRR